MDGRPHAHEFLEEARQRLGLGVDELWTDCLAMGGNTPMPRLQGILGGQSDPTRHEYDLIAQCLNEHLASSGSTDRVPYAEEVWNGFS